jgi:hypothetical protein
MLLIVGAAVYKLITMRRQAEIGSETFRIRLHRDAGPIAAQQNFEASVGRSITEPATLQLLLPGRTSQGTPWHRKV